MIDDREHAPVPSPTAFARALGRRGVTDPARPVADPAPGSGETVSYTPQITDAMREVIWSRLGHADLPEETRAAVEAATEQTVTLLAAFGRGHGFSFLLHNAFPSPSGRAVPREVYLAFRDRLRADPRICIFRDSEDYAHYSVPAGLNTVRQVQMHGFAMQAVDWLRQNGNRRVTARQLHRLAFEWPDTPRNRTDYGIVVAFVGQHSNVSVAQDYPVRHGRRQTTGEAVNWYQYKLPERTSGLGDHALRRV